MATRKLRQESTPVIAGTEVTTCPRPDCPNPTLHIAKSGAKYHCIGCWRRFTRSGRLRVAQQKPPPKRWLRQFSTERLNGPPPELVQTKLIIRLRLRPARSGPSTPPPVSIATEHTDSLPAASVATENDDSFDVISVTATLSEEEDDDMTSTARYDGATASFTLLSSIADSRYATGSSSRSGSPSTPGIDDFLNGSFPAWYAGATDLADSMFSSIADSRHVAGPSRRSRSLSIATPVIDEDCECTGSSPDEVIPVRSSIVRALKLIQGGRTFKACRGRSTGIRTGLMVRV